MSLWTEQWLAKEVRPRFSRILSRGEVYLANHSLGRPLDQMEADVQEGISLWYSQMDGAWDGWMREVDRFRTNIARVLGYTSPDSIVPKASAGQGLRAVLNAMPTDRPVQVVATQGEFDSVDFILKAYEGQGRAGLRWVDPEPGAVPLFSGSRIAKAVGPGVDLVVAPLVFFTTGQVLQGVEELVARCRQVGALLVLDVYHAAGVLPLSLEEVGCDFAIGGCYKYLRGGPGAGYLAVHPRVLAERRLKTLDTGWFAKKRTFGYERSDRADYADGGRGWFESTLPVLPFYQARSGLDFTLDLGIESIRQNGLAQLDRFRSLAQGIPLAWVEHHGAFILVESQEPLCHVGELKERGINVDTRGRYVRIGPDLLTTDDELEAAAKALRTLNFS